MDQIERSVAALIAVIKQVNTSIQRLSTYENIVRLGTAAVNEVVSVSAFLGLLNVSTILRGIATGTGGANGSFNIAIQLKGNSDSAGGANGMFNITNQLVGNIAGQSNLSSVNLQGTSYRMVGSSAGISGADSVLKVATQLIGSVEAAWSSCAGNLSVDEA